MENKQNNNQMGDKKYITYIVMGISVVLTIIFTILKVTEVINWNWFWVLSPAIFCMILLVLMVILLIIVIKVNKVKKSKGN